jgi:hypothetical protein
VMAMAAGSRTILNVRHGKRIVFSQSPTANRLILPMQRHQSFGCGHGIQPRPWRHRRRYPHSQSPCAMAPARVGDFVPVAATMSREYRRHDECRRAGGASRGISGSIAGLPTWQRACHAHRSRADPQSTSAHPRTVRRTLLYVPKCWREFAAEAVSVQRQSDDESPQQPST